MLIKQNNLVLSLMSALMIGFSYPPFNGFLSWIAFIPLIEIWHRENPNKSFLYGYIFGFFSNLITLYWIGLNSGADKTTVLVSLIAALIYLSLFPGFLGFLISFLLKKTIKPFFNSFCMDINGVNQELWTIRFSLDKFISYSVQFFTIDSDN